ncbi:hypothetical protein, conserved [Plasmodium gonderi]|uniref:Uncharacterized protein n=1 Tax=Plasmodium gonderi TaxID=77519 RepID=A0A1Y1JKP8_PLAGO|nr:hypothetical protein, conserved [Plasmodium gonderi]GAW80993.1 hypothetical protein, conserved [Plasmodium gonderi]
MQNTVDPDSIPSGNIISQKCNNGMHIFNEGKQNSSNKNRKDQEKGQIEKNYLIIPNKQKNVPYISGDNITEKDGNNIAQKECKIVPTTNNTYYTHKVDCLRHKNSSQNILINEEEASTKKSLEEAVNRRKKISEMILANSSLNLSLSNCNFENFDIRKKTSLYNSDYGCGMDFENHVKYSKKVSEGNYSGITNQIEDRKGETTNRFGYGNDDSIGLSRNNHLNNLLHRSNLTYRIKDLSLGNSISIRIGDEVGQRNDQRHGDKKDNSNDNFKCDDEIDDYKTFLTLDSNQTIFKTKPLKLPDISFLNSSSRVYNTLDFSNAREENSTSKNLFRNKILYEKLDGLSFDLDEEDDSVGGSMNISDCRDVSGVVNFTHGMHLSRNNKWDSRRKLNLSAEQNTEKDNELQNKTGMFECSNKNFFNKNVDLLELKKEKQNNVVENYIKMNKVENFNREKLINNWITSINRIDYSNPISHMHHVEGPVSIHNVSNTMYSENCQKNNSHRKSHIHKMINQQNNEIIGKNAFEYNFLKNNSICNSSYRRKTIHLGDNSFMYNNARNYKIEKDTYYTNRISNTSDICPANYKFSNVSEVICNGRNENHTCNHMKYGNMYMLYGQPYDEKKNTQESKTYRSNSQHHNSHLNTIERFKEMLISVAKDNLNEYAKCIQSINDERLKSYKYYIKQVNDYNFSQYVNATFRESIPVKGIEESVLTNSDTFSSMRNSECENHKSASSIYCGNSSCEQLANVSLESSTTGSANDYSSDNSCDSDNATGNYSHSDNSGRHVASCSLKVYKKKKKKKIKPTKRLKSISKEQFNSCPERIKNEQHVSANHRDKKYIHSKNNSYEYQMSSKQNKRQTCMISESKFENGAKNNYHYTLEKLDSLKEKGERNRVNDVTFNSVQNNYVNENLKKKNKLHEQSLSKKKYLARRSNLCNQDCACSSCSSYRSNSIHSCSSKMSDQTSQFLKKEKKKKKRKEKNIKIYSRHSNGKNQKNTLFSFYADSRNCNSELNNSSISILQNSLFEWNCKKLILNDKQNNLQENLVNVTSTTNCNDTTVDDAIKKNATNGCGSESQRSTPINEGYPMMNENYGDYTEKKYLQESLQEREDKCMNMHMTCNVDQRNTNEWVTYENVMHIRENFKARNKTHNQNLYTQNSQKEIDKIPSDKIDNLCVTKGKTKNSHPENQKSYTCNLITEENMNIRCKNYDSFKDKMLTNVTSMHSKDRKNLIETDGKENSISYNIKRECSSDHSDFIFLNKKEKQIIDGGNDNLNFNLQINSYNYKQLRENDKIHIQNHTEMNNLHNCNLPFYNTDICQGKDIKEIIKNNKTRIEHLYDNEVNQSHLCVDANFNGFKYNTDNQMEGKENQTPSFVNKFHNSYNSEKNYCSYSINSYNEDSEDNNIITCSLDSFNEEFNNPISVPTPADSIFSDVSMHSPQKKNLNDISKPPNFERNQMGDMTVTHQHSPDGADDYGNSGNYFTTDMYNPNSSNLQRGGNASLGNGRFTGNTFQIHKEHVNYNKEEEQFYGINLINKKDDEKSLCLTPSYFPKREDTSSCSDNLKNLKMQSKYNSNMVHDEHQNNFVKYKNGMQKEKRNIYNATLDDENSIYDRKGINDNRIVTENMNHLDMNLICKQKKNISMQKTYEDAHQKNNNIYDQMNNSSDNIRNNIIGVEECEGEGIKEFEKKKKKYTLHKIVNTLEIKETKIKTKQGIFEITSEGEILFTFLGRSEIKEYKNVKRNNMNIDISKPRKLLFIIEINGINIKIKDVLINDILDFYNLLEEELPKAHKVRYEYAYDVIETLKKHTPKVSLTKKWLGVYNLMSNGTTPDFIATLKNNMFIDKVEIKNNQVTFILKDRNTVTLNIDDLNGVTTKITRQMKKKGEIGERGEQNSTQVKKLDEKSDKQSDVFSKEIISDDEQDVKAVLLNLQILLKKTGVSIDIIIQNWCNTLQAYSQCLSLLTKGNAEYTLRLKKELANVTGKTEILRREIYFSIFPVIIEE